MEFTISELYTIAGINRLVSEFYNKYNRKAWIEYFGSKGYLAGVDLMWEIEGSERGKNRIWHNELKNPNWLVQWDKTGIKLQKTS